MNPPLYLYNISLLRSGIIQADSSLTIQDGKIAAIGTPGLYQPPQSARVVDGESLIAVPGFVDIQINGAFGMDFTVTPEAIYTVAARLPAFGVTSFLPTIITSPSSKVEAALQVWQQGAPPGFRGAVPLGLHLEGPMINPGKKGAHDPVYIQPPSVDLVAGWSPARGVRLVTLAPELPGAQPVIAALLRAGVKVSAGHSLATYEEGMQAFAAGVTCGTHLFNAMPTLHHRTPGITGALLQHPTVQVGLIVDGVHVHPAMINLAWKSKPAGTLILVTDAMAALGMPPGSFKLGDYSVTVDQSVARLPDGTLAGSILSMDAAVRNLIRYTGCSLAQAAACAAENPARLLGLQDKGGLVPGMDADLVLLSPEGIVQATLVQGQVLYSQTAQLEVQA